MLKEIHKFASETSRPIAICGTQKHTHGQINGVVQPRNELKMWNPRKMLLLHNSREMLARLLNRRIRHLCTTYRRQKCNDFYPKYAMYMMFRCYNPRSEKHQPTNQKKNKLLNKRKREQRACKQVP